MDHFRALIALALLLVAPGAFAAQYNVWYPNISGQQQNYYATPLQACGPVYASWGVQPGTIVYQSAGEAQCMDSNGSFRGYAYLTVRTVNCTAPSTAEFKVTGAGGLGDWACVDPQDALCQTLAGQTTYATAPGRVLPGATSCSAVGCNIVYSSTVIIVKNSAGQTVTEGDAVLQSSKCTYSSATGSTEDTCKGGSTGQLNGATVCVPYDPKLNTIESFKDTQSASSNSDGDSSTGESSSSTICIGNSCTTTITNNTTVNGVPKTSTETKTQDKADYCKDNPRAPQCSEAGTFTGSCQSSFVCSGDAIQCAAAKAVNDQLCEFKDAFDVAAGTQAAANALTNGTDTPDPKLTARIENLGNFNQTNPLSSSCPSDASVTAGGQSFSIPLSQACGTLQVIGNLAVAFTLLGATLFVLKGLN